MRGYRVSLLLILVTVLSLAQSGSELVTPEIRRVGRHLACLCGVCKNTVADCAMLECGHSKPARIKIRSLLKEGKSDQAIIARFVAEEGKQALAVPPAEGFNLLAWVMPFAAIGAGLMLIGWFIRRMLPKPQTAAATDSRILDRYHEQIEKDLAQLD